MALSMFDQMQHEFTCPAPKCGYRFHEVLRRLFKLDVVNCPKCGAAIDIRESKRSLQLGSIGKDFDSAREIDKQRMQKK